MAQKKSYIPLKVLISYLALIALVVTVGWILYTENIVFSKTGTNISADNEKVLKVSNLLSDIYKNEGYARRTLQFNGETELNNYILHTDSVKSEIESCLFLINLCDEKFSQLDSDFVFHFLL